MSLVKTTHVRWMTSQDRFPGRQLSNGNYGNNQ